MIRAEDWADRRDSVSRDDAYEPVYPDGTVRHECWNSIVLKKQPAKKKGAAASKTESTQK